MRLGTCTAAMALGLSVFGCASTESNRTTDDSSGRRYVQAMGGLLAGAEQFTVRVHMDDDQIVDAGPISGPTQRTLRVRRPDRLAVQVTHPQGRRLVWYDGARLVCLEVGRGAYASFPFKGSVAQVFAALRDGHHYVRPLAGLCDPDPAASICAGARRISHLGRKDLGGRPCNVVQVDRPDARITLWIADEPRPLLLQASVRENGPAERERIARFDNWDFQTRIPDADFEPRLPAGAFQIEMIDLTGFP